MTATERGLGLLLLGALCLFFSRAAFAVNCPPVMISPYLLEPGRSDILVADVILVAKSPADLSGPIDAVILDVTAVYVGSAPRRIAVENRDFIFPECRIFPSLASFPIGSRLMVKVRQDPVSGLFSSSMREDQILIEDDSLNGFVFPPD